MIALHGFTSSSASSAQLGTGCRTRSGLGRSRLSQPAVTRARLLATLALAAPTLRRSTRVRVARSAQLLPVTELEESEARNLPTSSCVKIHAVGAPPSYLLPWQVTEQQSWTGSGFAVELNGRWLILTNAHVVDHGLVLRVTRQSQSRKVPCKVVVIAHDLDLALLDVEDEEFRASVPPVAIAEKLPKLFSEVEVIGYPQGGTSVCVTKGVVSRVDAQMYAHASSKGIKSWSYNNPGRLLIIQVDAAINSGNSGGPALDKLGRVVGVASSAMGASQNIGYIIPCSLVLNLFEEFVKTGTWCGIPEPGLKFRTLESCALRSYLKMPDGQTGVQLTTVAPKGAMATSVKEGDVLLSIDGQSISNEGTVVLSLACGQEVQVPFEHIITGKRRGDKTSLSMWRPPEGPQFEASAVFAPISPLVQRFDVPRSYFVFGGLVFSPFTTALMSDYFENDTMLHLPVPIYEKSLTSWQTSDEEVILLLRVLQDEVNEGVRSSSMRILDSVEGEPVKNMKELIHVAMSAIKEKKEYVRFGFLRFARDPGGIEVVEVMKVADILAANARILEEHRIPAPVSSDLTEIYDQYDVGLVDVPA